MLQQRGAVAMPVLTEPFAQVLGRLMSYYVPDQPMPVGVVAHPIQNVTPEDLDARAAQLVALIEAHLPPE